MKKNNKRINLSVVIIMAGVLLLGGTFAYTIMNASVTNGNYSGETKCFDIDYGITNDDNTTNNITGTLFPSKNLEKGLSGKVTLKIKNECNTFTGVGTLKLHLNSETSLDLIKTVDVARCEDSSTLETLGDITTSSDCTSSVGNWATAGSALKYAIYSSSSTSGTPLKVGYINSTSTNRDITLYDNITVNNDIKSFYIYIWMDGYLIDSSYDDLSFSGYIKAQVVQNG